MEELVREHSAYLDVAVIIAGYPETRDKWANTSVARELIAVKRTIVFMVHFAADSCCNASLYPVWYAEFELAMTRQGHGTGFMSFMLPGTHDHGAQLWQDRNFAAHDSQLALWFERMWLQLDRQR